MQFQQKNKLARLILTISLYCLPLLACNQPQPIIPNNQTPKATETPAIPTAKPLSLQTSLPPDKNYFLDNQIWGNPGDKQNLIQAIDNSLNYLKTSEAKTAYENYTPPEITKKRVEKSLKRFRELVSNSQNSQELQASVNKEFVFYKSIGTDNQGTIVFTGYYKPIYQASRKPSAEYRYPIYRLPEDFSTWSKPLERLI